MILNKYKDFISTSWSQSTELFCTCLMFLHNHPLNVTKLGYCLKQWKTLVKLRKGKRVWLILAWTSAGGGGTRGAIAHLAVFVVYREKVGSCPTRKIFALPWKKVYGRPWIIGLTGSSVITCRCRFIRFGGRIMMVLGQEAPCRTVGLTPLWFWSQVGTRDTSRRGKVDPGRGRAAGHQQAGHFAGLEGKWQKSAAVSVPTNEWGRRNDGGCCRVRTSSHQPYKVNVES